MEQKDYLLRQIEMIGIALQKVLSKIRPLKFGNELESAAIWSHQYLISEINIDLKLLQVLKKGELKEFLHNKNFKGEQIELLASVYESLAENQKTVEYKKEYLEKAMELLHLATEISSTSSFERLSKQKAINHQIENL